MRPLSLHRRLRRWGLVLAAALTASLALPATAHEPAPPHLLVFTGTYGFRHDGIQEAAATIAHLAATTGAFTVEVTADPAALTPATYDRVDGLVLLNNTGLGGSRSPLSAEQRKAFMQFAGCGGSIVAIHAAADSGGGWPEFDALLGTGGFDSHPHFSFESRENPAGPQAFNPAVISDVDIQVEQVDGLDHVTTTPWHGFETFRITEELYRYKGDPRQDPDLDVVLSLDDESHYWRRNIGAGPSAGGMAPSVANPVSNPVNRVPVTAMPDDNPVAWVKTHGSLGARVFYTNLGHTMETWKRADFRLHLFHGILWAAEVRPDATCLAGPTS